VRSRDTEVSFLKNKLRDVEQSFASLREKQKDLEQEYIVVKSKYSKLEAHYESVHEQKVFWICMCCFQYERPCLSDIQTRAESRLI
jgi:predicted nuclease with TOPRIM domain